MINLTQEERDKFATWLEQKADSDEKMALQTTKLDLGPGGDPIIKMLRAEALAARVIAKKLRGIEEFTVGN